MNKKILSSFGYVALLFTALKSIWDIDIVVGSLTEHGKVITLYGNVPALDFYHMALIRLLLAIFLMFSITLYMILTQGQTKTDEDYQE